MLQADCRELCLVLPAGVHDLVRVDRRGAEDTRGCPVVDRYRVLLVLTNGQKFVTGWGELQLPDSPAMEVVQVSEHLPSGDLPNKNVNHLGLALGSHLPGGYDILPRVEGQADHIFLVEIEELLNIRSLIHDDTQSGGGEREVVLVDVLQVTSGVKASEAVSVLELDSACRTVSVLEL